MEGDPRHSQWSMDLSSAASNVGQPIQFNAGFTNASYPTFQQQSSPEHHRNQQLYDRHVDYSYSASQGVLAEPTMNMSHPPSHNMYATSPQFLSSPTSTGGRYSISPNHLPMSSSSAVPHGHALGAQSPSQLYTRHYATQYHGYPNTLHGPFDVHTASYQPVLHVDPSCPPMMVMPRPREQQQCRWGGRCGVVLDDITPSGISRHVKEYHFSEATGDNPWHNKNRGLCQWWDADGLCDRDMNYASFGKHVAAVHLRSTASRCPYCYHELGRVDSLDRHIKNYCPQSPPVSHVVPQ